MYRLVALLSLSAAAASCTNLMSFGPGRVTVALEYAAVQTVDHIVLFPKSLGEQVNVNRPSRQAIRLNISSGTNLLKYFKDWDRQLQVRCSVVGSANGRAYSGFAVGPFPDTIKDAELATLQRPAEPKHHYTIYAFIDLVAEDDEYNSGKLATTLNLKSDRFEALACHLLGVTKAPVLFPRSNDVVLQEEQVHALIRQASAR
jgi:hypothetical protein